MEAGREVKKGAREREKPSNRGERERRREGGKRATYVEFRRILQEGGTSNKNMVL